MVKFPFMPQPSVVPMAQIKNLAERIVDKLSPRDRAFLSRVTDDSPARFSIAVDEAIQSVEKRARETADETQADRIRRELARGR